MDRAFLGDTMLRYTTLFVLINACLLGACKNGNYCPGNLNDDCRLARDAGGPKTCAADVDCTDPNAKVCDLNGAKTCVQCTTAESAACTDTTPVCGDDHACRACAVHADCAASLACLPDGSCGTDANVAYVDPAGTDNTTCTKATPCIKLSAALATNKPYVKLHGKTDEAVDQAISIDSHNVTLLADPGAQLTSTKNGLLLEVKGSSQVSIYDLEITGASGGAGFGISLPAGNTAKLELNRAKVTSNVAGGISISGGNVEVSQTTIGSNQGNGITANSGALTVSRSTINGNQAIGISNSGALTVSQSVISGNQGGGIAVMSGTFVVVGNFFFNNGNVGSAVSGIAIGTTESPINRLEFNSFNQNRAQGGVGQGVSCVAGAFTAKDNILSNNGTLTLTDQVSGSCTHAFSILHPAPKPPLGTNSGEDPMFVDETKGDLHIQATSLARHYADPAADLTGIASHDIDGDLRVAPADIGADQVK
jgi:hypothetical protein